MYSLFITISVIVAIFLVIVILLQSSKGGGLAGITAGGGMGTMFGSRRTADFLSKATWWLGGALIVLSLLINLLFVSPERTPEEMESIIQSSRSQGVPTEMAVPEAPQQAPVEEKK